ncbi:MAG TPA: UDP-2,3-diacylglucosamine diphosphatase LpxI [Bosea sp. (in: a-proteobacteria)]|uniref:LpxI family protein n=1 Tax=Bosea sp. (in: a-proteobacteria) TaxID=1871050 RepID=UPI002E1096EA|nr:UDP-2,3-diacylglucosamine diphosphatase LpxI [Bosea sp. (in: a-proteobacteria)]HEV7335746.1 UDP-2,3-diacylglucosamine diphosphatase LpxI [Bosea sp. (in: a-proteobacteria)]
MNTGPAEGPGKRSGLRLAILAGAGEYPAHVARNARAAGAEVYVAALSGAANIADFPGCDAQEYRLGQLGRLLDALKRREVTDIVMIGALPRPSFGALAPELSTLKYLPHFARAFQGGDDHLLRGVVSFFEGQGFRVGSPAEMAPEIVAPLGALGRTVPASVARDALLRGFDLLAALSPFDIGQGAVIADHRVIAVEAAEGTDAMLERVATLVRAGRLKLGKGDGVLVKAPKHGQDLRVDMPAIGPDTVARVAEAGLAGIAVRAGGVLVGDRARLAAQADAAGIFIEGVA